MNANSKLVSRKPWAGGLQDSILAADLISKSSLLQKDRISLIIIDSTLEIAYKEYLVHEKNIGVHAFKKIFDNRALVQAEVFKSIRIPKKTIQKINYYYKLRCDLIHERASPNVNPDEVESYRQIVEGLLKKMFKLDFGQ